MAQDKHFSLRGFTLLELLIVVGILGVILSIVLIAINPIEHSNRAHDVATKAIAQDFSTATNSYFASVKSLPWQKDTTCRQELSKGPTLKDVPTCVKDITESQQLGTNVVAQSQSKDIYISECNSAIALCYHPKSQLFGSSPDTKYTKNGALNPNCQGNIKSDECYVCTFSTNDAHECFEALNPNGNLARADNPDPHKAIPIPQRHSKKLCNKPASGEIGCMADIVTDSSGNPLSSINLPAGFGPAQLHTAYHLPCTPEGPVNANCATPISFGPKTIAIIDAYDAPNLESDLASYSATFGLPPCTKANGCLTVVNQNGLANPLPPMNLSWAIEITLDVQMAHATCQTCKILVVEANSNSFSDLGAAVNRAAEMGVTAISNSYGALEASSSLVPFLSTYDTTYYNHPGIFITASSGDSGAQMYPSTSSNVISVGGTTLSLFPDNTYASESAWLSTGSGCSYYETANSFQTNLYEWLATGCGNRRGDADVSADADPNTGVAVYMSYLSNGPYYIAGGWYIVGGTSVSSPVMAAALTMDGTPPSKGPAAAYLYANRNKFRDITTYQSLGCGTSICIVGTGYDGPTGLGSPDFASDNTFLPPLLSPTPTPLPNPGIWGEAVVFSGKTPLENSVSSDWITQYLVKPYDQKMDFQTNAMTVEAWIKPDIPYFGKTGAVWYQIVNGIGGLVMEIKPNGDNISYEYDFTALITNSLGSCQDTDVTSANRLDPQNIAYWRTVPKSEFTQWKHVTGVLNGQVLAIYEDGVLLNTDYFSASLCKNSGRNQVIGARLGDKYNFIDFGLGSGVNVDNFFNGAIDEVRISDNVRYYGTFTPPTKPFASDDHTKMLYHFDNTPNDSSVNTFNGVYIGNYYYILSTIPTSPISTTPLPPSPTPIPIVNCSATQAVSTDYNPLTIQPGQTISDHLIIDNFDTSGCPSSTFTITQGNPYNFTISSIPSNITIDSNSKASIPYTISIPPTTPAGKYYITFIVYKNSQNPIPEYENIQVVIPSPTPGDCSQYQSVSLGLSNPVNLNAGDAMTNVLTIKNNDASDCTSTYTIKDSFPDGWTIGSIPSSITLAGGASKSLSVFIQTPTSATSGTYNYSFWVTKDTQSSINPVTGTIYLHAVPTSTPSPTPRLTATPTPTQAPGANTPTPTPTAGSSFACGTGNFPSDIPMHAGEMKAYLWKNEGSFLICQPPQAGPYEIDVSFDPNFSAPVYDGMHDFPVYDGTRGNCCQTFHGFAFAENNTWGYMYQHFGNLVYALISRPNNGGYGFIPAYDVWANYQCGKTLYWRLVDFYNPTIIKSDTHADVISCTNSLGLYYLDWSNYYFDTTTKTQKLYNSRWDGNYNKVMDEEDYWWEDFRGQVSTYQ